MGYIFSSVLVLYSDYVTYLIFPAQLLFLIFCRKKSVRKIRGIWAVWGISLFFLIPWLLVFPEQLRVGKSAAENLSGWKSVVGGVGFKEVALVWVKMLIGRISFTDIKKC